MAYFTKYICSYNLDENNMLLLNTLTSAIDIVNKDTFIKIQNMMNGHETINLKSDFELYSSLKARGYIFDTLQDEKNILNYFQHTNKKILEGTISTEFKICPTMGCNLRCTYCYEKHKQHKNYKLLSDKQLNMIFDYITKCNNVIKKQTNSNIKIGLFGGEPLLKKNYSIVEKVLKFAEQIKTRVYITTNGTTIDDYRDLLEKHKKNVSIQITLDGNELDHNKRRIRANGVGTFDEICEGIDKILNLGIRLNVRLNIDRENINGIGDLKKLFDKCAWSKNSLFKTYATPIRSYEKKKPNNILTDSEILEIFMKNGWYGKENSFVYRLDSSVYDVAFRIFEKQNKGKKLWQITYCSASQGSQYCFTPDGMILTCLKCVGNEKYSIGNFDENHIEINHKKFDMWTKRDPFEIAKCKECKFILLCAGGCPFYALKNHVDINCAVCNDIEKTLEVYVKHIKNRFLKCSI